MAAAAAIGREGRRREMGIETKTLTNQLGFRAGFKKSFFWSGLGLR
jgi:hypothetical protein